MMSPEQISQQVMRFDTDRALAYRFAPADKRQALLALSAFDFELAQIPAQTSEFLVRRIRYQFWRDALENENGGDHPLGQLLVSISTDDALLSEGLQSLLEAHEANAEAEPGAHSILEQLAAREQHLFQLTCGQLAPFETTELGAGFFADCGLLYGAARSMCRWPAMMRADAQARTQLLDDLQQSKAQIQVRLGNCSLSIRPALLPLALVSPYLNLTQRTDEQGDEPLHLSALRRSWLYWRAMRRGIYL